MNYKEQDALAVALRLWHYRMLELGWIKDYSERINSLERHQKVLMDSFIVDIIKFAV